MLYCKEFVYFLVLLLLISYKTYFGNSIPVRPRSLFAASGLRVWAQLYLSVQSERVYALTVFLAWGSDRSSYQNVVLYSLLLPLTRGDKQYSLHQWLRNNMLSSETYTVLFQIIFSTKVSYIHNQYSLLRRENNCTAIKYTKNFIHFYYKIFRFMLLY